MMHADLAGIYYPSTTNVYKELIVESECYPTRRENKPTYIPRQLHQLVQKELIINKEKKGGKSMSTILIHNLLRPVRSSVHHL